jgi:hypothetical protein
VLPYPHHSDPTWDDPKVVYGDEHAPADDGAYADRMQEWAWDKYDAAWGAVTATHRTPRAVQEMLSYYYDRPVELVTIIYQTNRSNGYNYPFYRWRYSERATDQE